MKTENDPEDTILSSDFELIDDDEFEGHPARDAFVLEMKGRCYGYEAINDAWSWFATGWSRSVIDTLRGKKGK